MNSLARFVFIVLAVVSSSTYLRAQTPTYSPAVVAKVGDTVDGYTLTGFLEPALISEAGEPVYLASFAGGQGIFKAGKLIVKTGDTISGKTLTYVSSLALGSDGTVAFLGGFRDGSGIFTNSALLVRTGDVVDGQPIYNFYRGIQINAQHETAFQVSFGTTFPTATAVLFRNSAGTVSTIAVSGSQFDGKVLNGVGAPALSENGTVAYRAEFLNDNDPNDTGIVNVDARNGGAATLLLESGGAVGDKTATVFGFPTNVNEQLGTLVSTSYNGGIGLARLQQGSGRFLAVRGSAIDDKTLTFIGNSAANGNGDVVFYGAFSGGTGIFSPGHLLIGTGAQAGSNVISAILFNSAAINNTGAVIFIAQLNDSSRAVIVATPLGI